jgi:hypothetical protein
LASTTTEAIITSRIPMMPATIEPPVKKVTKAAAPRNVGP